MKKLILLSLALASTSTIAQETVRLPLSAGGSAQFSGESTLTSPEAPQAVAETSTFGRATLIDLYEQESNGIVHSQFLLEDGKLERVVEKKVAPDETEGPYVGKPLSAEGRGILGLASLFGQDEDRDARLAPWLDLIGGGIAQGACNTQKKKDAGPLYGSLVNATAFRRSPGLTQLSYVKGGYGTGMMVSMLEHAAEEFTRLHPEMEVYIGDIAKQQGGFFPPHKSHQSGLDADVMYLGTDRFDSQIDKNGEVKASFETAKNWEFFRLLLTQRIFDKKELSAVSMILVGPRIKQHFCAWAKEQKLTSAADKEVLRMLRPTEGHDDHFHLRLKCSPHYPLCLRQNYEPKETGCAS